MDQQIRCYCVSDRPLAIDRESGTDEAGTVESGTDEAGTVESGTVEDGTVEDGTVEAGTVEDGTVESGTVESGTDEAGTDEAGTDEDGTVESGTVESGTVESGTEARDSAFCGRLHCCAYIAVSGMDYCSGVPIHNVGHSITTSSSHLATLVIDTGTNTAGSMLK